MTDQTHTMNELIKKLEAEIQIIEEYDPHRTLNADALGQIAGLTKAIAIVRQHQPRQPEVAEGAVDWTEDSTHENGNYHCKCRQCDRSFIGHKRRVLCKACATPQCPDIEPIRKLAREVGYAVGEHGSKIRDYDLIAAPWTDQAVAYNVLIDHLCKGLNAAMIDGITGKPLGRRSCVLQIKDRWLKDIDLSIMPRSTERESVRQHQAAGQGEEAEICLAISSGISLVGAGWSIESAVKATLERLRPYICS